MTIARHDFLYVRRPAEFTQGHVHAVERDQERQMWGMHTLCGLAGWQPWQVVPPEELVTEKLCGVCDKGIRRRIRVAEEATAIARIRAEAAKEAGGLLEGMVENINRTLGMIEVAARALGSAMDTLEPMRAELWRLVLSPESEGDSPPTEEQGGKASQGG